MGMMILDAKGLKCPLPVLRARKAMKAVAPGDILEVLSTDPSSVRDFQNYCETTGDTLVDCRQEGDVYVFRIRKSDRV